MSHNTFTFAGINDPAAVTRVVVSGDCAWVSVNLANTTVDIWADRAHTNTLEQNLDAIDAWVENVRGQVIEAFEALLLPTAEVQS